MARSSLGLAADRSVHDGLELGELLAEVGRAHLSHLARGVRALRGRIELKAANGLELLVQVQGVRSHEGRHVQGLRRGAVLVILKRSEVVPRPVGDLLLHLGAPRLPVDSVQDGDGLENHQPVLETLGPSDDVVKKVLDVLGAGGVREPKDRSNVLLLWWHRVVVRGFHDGHIDVLFVVREEGQKASDTEARRESTSRAAVDAYLVGLLASQLGRDHEGRIAKGGEARSSVFGGHRSIFFGASLDQDATFLLLCPSSCSPSAFRARLRPKLSRLQYLTTLASLRVCWCLAVSTSQFRACGGTRSGPLPIV